MVLFLGCVSLLLVVEGLYQDCTQGQMSQKSSTFSQWPRFDIVSHKSFFSLSLSAFGMLLNKVIQNVDCFPILVMYWLLMLPHYHMIRPDLQRINALNQLPLQSMVNECSEGSTSIPLFKQDQNCVNES
jgi:hypothetical protein